MYLLLKMTLFLGKPVSDQIMPEKKYFPSLAVCMAAKNCIFPARNPYINMPEFQWQTTAETHLCTILW